MEKIKQIFETGTCDLYEKIKHTSNPKMEFINIHGVGPKKADELVNSGFTSINDLRNCEDINSVLNDVQIKGLNHYEHLLKKIPRSEIEKHEKLLKRMLQYLQIHLSQTVL